MFETLNHFHIFLNRYVIPQYHIIWQILNMSQLFDDIPQQQQQTTSIQTPWNQLSNIPLNGRQSWNHPVNVMETHRTHSLQVRQKSKKKFAKRRNGNGHGNRNGKQQHRIHIHTS